MSAYAHDPRVAVVPCGFDDVEYRVLTPAHPLPGDFDLVYSKDDGTTWTSTAAPASFDTADEAIAHLIGPPAGGA